MEDNNRQQDYEKEQYLGIATLARTIAGAVLVLGLLAPIFKSDPLTLRQIILVICTFFIALGLSIDAVSIAFKKERQWITSISVFFLLAWFALLLL